VSPLSSRWRSSVESAGGQIISFELEGLSTRTTDLVCLSFDVAGSYRAFDLDVVLFESLSSDLDRRRESSDSHAREGELEEGREGGQGREAGAQVSEVEFGEAVEAHEEIISALLGLLP